MVTSFQNGHLIYWDEKTSNWHYKDGSIAIECQKCIKCDKEPTAKGHDDCISDLPGITNACCGHGKEGYLQFEDGTVIRGIFSVERFKVIKKQ